MKHSFFLSILLSISFYACSQFEKNEKLIGGSLFFLNSSKNNINADQSGGSFGPASKENNLIIQPEFGYVIKKNLVINLMASVSSEKYSDLSNNTISKTKWYTIGIGLSDYKFFKKDFGLFFRVQTSLTPAWNSYFYSDGTSSSKERSYLTDLSFIPGGFYRFTKHFCMQTQLGYLSYDHKINKRDDVPDRQVDNQFSAGFYLDLRLSAFYIF